MIPVLFRTFIVYLLLHIVMQLMGKRQIAELEMSELITTLLLSELAVLPIENVNVPLAYAIVPIVTVVTLEIGSSVLLTHSGTLRARSANTPGILICRGEIDQQALSDNRMSLDEFFAALRQQGIADPREVEYAILETNGALSVIPRTEHRPVTPSDLAQSPAERGIMHLIVSNGAVNRRSLSLLGKDTAWLESLCRKRGLPLRDIFCLMCDDSGQSVLIPKSKKSTATRKNTKKH